jgi:hypothetical protein
MPERKWFVAFLEDERDHHWTYLQNFVDLNKSIFIVIELIDYFQHLSIFVCVRNLLNRANRVDQFLSGDKNFSGEKEQK